MTRVCAKCAKFLKDVPLEPGGDLAHICELPEWCECPFLTSHFRDPKEVA